MDVKDLVFVYVVGWGCAVVGLFGLVGNAFSFLVLLQKDFRRSNSNLYLVVLCVYDTVFLALTFTTIAIDWIVYGFDAESLFSLEFILPAGVVIDPIVQVVVSGSIYTTVALTCDRCIAVTRPLKWSSICTRRRVKVILLLVFLWSVISQSPFMFELRYEKVFLFSLNGTFLHSVETDYSQSGFHRDVYLEYLVPLLTLVIPITTIVIPNLVIILTLRRQQSSLKTSRSNAQQTGSRSNRLTAQVLFISLFTLVSRVLHGVSYIMLDDVYYANQCSLACACVTAVSILFVNVNAAINFVCYCLFGEKFRAAFVRRVASCCGLRSSGVGGVRRRGGINSTIIGTTTTITTTPTTTASVKAPSCS